jgi:hypothetical protein
MYLSNINPFGGADKIAVVLCGLYSYILPLFNYALYSSQYTMSNYRRWCMVFRDVTTFRRNISPLRSGSKSKPSRKWAEAGGTLSESCVENPAWCRPGQVWNEQCERSHSARHPLLLILRFWRWDELYLRNVELFPNYTSFQPIKSKQSELHIQQTIQLSGKVAPVLN